MNIICLLDRYFICSVQGHYVKI
uniref:Uncharacterized protein n=1 Tax=Arundo donax TaxID=35708 RepID=A0A0A9HD32_ARUDO